MLSSVTYAKSGKLFFPPGGKCLISKHIGNALRNWRTVVKSPHCSIIETLFKTSNSLQTIYLYLKNNIKIN